MNKIISDFMQISVKRRIGFFIVIIAIYSSVMTYQNIYSSQKNPCMILNIFQKIPITEDTIIGVEEYRKLSHMFITVSVKDTNGNYRKQLDDVLLSNEFISEDGTKYYKEHIEISILNKNKGLFIIIRKI